MRHIPFKVRRSLLRKASKAVLVALLAVAGSAIVRQVLDPLLMTRGAFFIFSIGIAAAAMVGGFEAGIIATILAIPVCDYLFVEPRYTWFVHDASGDAILLSLLAVVGIGVNVLIARIKRETLEATQSAAQSERKLGMVAAAMPEIMFIATPTGEASFVNQRCSDYSGIPTERLLGFGWLQMLHQDERNIVRDSWSKAMESGNDFDMTFRLGRFDGVYRWFKVHATPSRDSGGQIVEWVGICTDVEEQKQLQTQLSERTEALARSNEDLRQFASVASHDLQAPLRTIGAFGEMLAEENRGKLSAESEQCVRYISDGVEQMQNLIDDLLTYAEAGSGEQQLGPADLNAVLSQATAQLQSVITETNTQIHCETLPTVYGNERALVRVLQNLVSNAIKYRRSEPPEIRISAQLRGDEWLFAVQDNGMGFEMKYAARIFNTFERLHSSAEIKGTGIGLAIVRRLVERHGGRAWAESVPGKGSLFYFTLPDRTHSFISNPTGPPFPQADRVLEDYASTMRSARARDN